MEGEREAKPYDGEKAWSSINHSILSLVLLICEIFNQSHRRLVMAPRDIPNLLIKAECISAVFHD